jgi:6-phosphofructokinase 1
MSKLEGNVLIAQGGGPTAVINESIVGVALEARKFPQVNRVYGARHGVAGILNEDFLDLTQETTHNLEEVALTPSSALGSTRMKPTREDCLKMFTVLKAHNIRYFFYVGGNDSADTCRIVNEAADNENYEMRCIHVPKTIDNDLPGNDHTPGYGSAARFVASAFAGANLDNRALPGAYIGVVMGRHAGFLTAASALAKKYPDDGPHLVYLPERVFCIERFAADVEAVYQKFGRCVIAVSEGVHNADGVPIVTTLQKQIERDAHGNVLLSGGALGDLLVNTVKEKTSVTRVRADTYGYVQRCFPGCVSDVDQQEAREVGEKAVHYALWHDLDGSVAIKRTGAYSVDYHLQPFENVAAQTRTMEDEFINEAGNNVTDAFIAYARPLIGSGFHTPARIRAPKVEKA